MNKSLEIDSLRNTITCEIIDAIKKQATVDKPIKLISLVPMMGEEIVSSGLVISYDSYDEMPKEVFTWLRYNSFIHENESIDFGNIPWHIDEDNGFLRSFCKEHQIDHDEFTWDGIFRRLVEVELILTLESIGEELQKNGIQIADDYSYGITEFEDTELYTDIDLALEPLIDLISNKKIAFGENQLIELCYKEKKNAAKLIDAFKKTNAIPKHGNQEVVKELFVIIDDESDDLLTWWNDLDTDWKTIFSNLIDRDENEDISENEIKEITLLSKVEIEGFTQLDLAPLKKLTQINVLKISNLKNTNWEILNNLTSLKTLLFLKCSFEEQEGLNITALQEITKLSFLWCTLETILPSIGTLQKLTQLIIQNCGLTTIDFVSNLQNLTKLNVSENQITTIQPVQNLSNLERFTMYRTLVEDLSPLTHLKKLDFLLIANNPQLKNVRIIGDIENLKRLYYPSTPIKKRDVRAIAKMNRNLQFELS